MTMTPLFAVLTAKDAFALLTFHAGADQPVDARSLWPEQQLLEDGGVIGCIACARVFNLQRRGGSYQHTCSCAAEGLGAPVEQQGRFMLPLELIGDSQQVLKELSDMLGEAGLLGKVGTPPREGEDPLGVLRSMINAWTIATSAGEDLGTLTAWSRNPTLVFHGALLDPHTYVFNLTREEQEEHFRRAVVGIIPARALFSVGPAFWRVLSGEENPTAQSPALVKWLRHWTVFGNRGSNSQEWFPNLVGFQVWGSQTFGKEWAANLLLLRQADTLSADKSAERAKLRLALGLRSSGLGFTSPPAPPPRSEWWSLFPAGPRPMRFFSDPVAEPPLTEEEESDLRHLHFEGMDEGPDFDFDGEEG